MAGEAERGQGGPSGQEGPHPVLGQERVVGHLGPASAVGDAEKVVLDAAVCTSESATPGCRWSTPGGSRRRVGDPLAGRYHRPSTGTAPRDSVGPRESRSDLPEGELPGRPPLSAGSPLDCRLKVTDDVISAVDEVSLSSVEIRWEEVASLDVLGANEGELRTSPSATLFLGLVGLAMQQRRWTACLAIELTSGAPVAGGRVEFSRRAACQCTPRSTTTGSSKPST